MTEEPFSAGTIHKVPLRFHAERHKLLAEAHTRPSTPLSGPTLAARITALSGESAAENDWKHMVALCRRFHAPEPSPGALWCVLDAGNWRLRWERHTEMSTWSFYKPIPENYIPALDETALDLAPREWLKDIPGDVLAAVHVTLVSGLPVPNHLQSNEGIMSSVADGAARVYTDFRPGADDFTRYLVVQPMIDPPLAGRIVLQLFEIESYRLMALLAFPLAREIAQTLSRLESEANTTAHEVAQEGDIKADRQLLNHLAGLAGQAQALAGRSTFRFAAARAYYGLVMERIQQLREMRVEGRPTIGDFMERRLAPAMRTCAAVADRQQAIIDHIARTSQLLSTRVEVATEVTNANLLASVDRNARLQVRLQQMVEGLSVAAISYYAVGLIGYVFKAISSLNHGFKPELATGITTPIVILAVWFTLHRLRKHMLKDL